MSSPLEDFYGQDEDEQMGSTHPSFDKITPGPPISQQTSELLQLAQKQDLEIEQEAQDIRDEIASESLHLLDTNIDYTDLAQSEDNGTIAAVHRSLSPVSPLPVRIAEPSNVPLLTDVNMNPTHQQIQDINNNAGQIDINGVNIPSGSAQANGTPLITSTQSRGQSSNPINIENMTDKDDLSTNDDALQQQLYASLEQEATSYDDDDVLDNSTPSNPEDSSITEQVVDIMEHEPTIHQEHTEQNTKPNSSDSAQYDDRSDHPSSNQTSRDVDDKMDESGAFKPISTDDVEVSTEVLNPQSDVTDTEMKTMNLPANPVKNTRLSPVSQVSPSVPAFFQPTSLPQSSSLPPPPHLATRSFAQNGALTSPTSLQHPLTQLRHPLPEVPSLPVSDENEEPRPFTVEEEKEYEAFQAIERDYVSKGQWDRFPNGSRLFIGMSIQALNYSKPLSL